MIDRSQLRYFLAVVEQGNFSRAAAQCNVTQPTLSVAIKKLESDLGTKLFARNSRRVRLTRAGTRFLDHARRIENEFNLAARSAQDQPEEPELRIGVLLSVPGAIVAEAMATLHRDAPGVRVELIEGNERELANLLSRRRIDVALTLVERGSSRFAERRLFEEGYSLAVATGHPSAGSETVDSSLVAEDMMIVRRHCEVLSETSRYFTQRGVRPHFAYRSANEERVMQLVASGLAVTVMPDCYRSAGIARPKLQGFDLRRAIGFAYNSDAESEPHTDHVALKALEQAVLVNCTQ